MKRSDLLVPIGPVFTDSPEPFDALAVEADQGLSAIRTVSSLVKRFDDLPVERQTAIASAEQFILFKVSTEAAREKDYLPSSTDATALVRRLREISVEVAFDTTSHPGFPYYEMLIAIIPAGAGVAIANFLAEIFVEWLRGKNSREIEIKLKNGASVKLRGPNATREEALAVLQEAERETEKPRVKLILPNDSDA